MSADRAATLVELACERAATIPDRTVYTFLADDGDVAMTFAQLDRRARTIAAWLLELERGRAPALLVYPPGLDYVAALFGCFYAGVPAVPALPPRGARGLARVEAILRDARAGTALSTLETMEAVRRRLPDSAEVAGLQWLATDRIPDELAAAWRDSPPASGDLALIQYTSGSTGTPRGVAVSHANLMHNVGMIRRLFGVGAGTRGVIWLPPHHDMGLIGGVLTPLAAGIGCVLLPPAAFVQQPFRWLDAVSRHRAHVSGGPDFAYMHCVRRTTPEEREQLDLSSWEVAFTGAEPVRDTTLADFERTFAPCGFRAKAFYPCYGLAEATLIVSGGSRHAAPVTRRLAAAALECDAVADAAPGDPTALTLVGCGQSLPDQAIEIVDPVSGVRCDPGKVGEIWVAGPSVARGFWNRPEDSEATFGARLAGSGEGPYLRTGDLGFLDGDELFVTGRLKDLIIVRGANHYPNDIEHTAERSHPSVLPGGAAAFGVATEDGERLVVAVELLVDTPAEEIAAAVREAVARHHELETECVVTVGIGTLPRTSSGKIRRGACRQAFQEGRLRPRGERHEPTPVEQPPATQH